MHKNMSDLEPSVFFLVHESNRIRERDDSAPSYLPLPDQLSLQIVNLEERPSGGGGADWPDRPNGSPGASGETLDLHEGPIPEASASADVTAADGQRLVEAVVQRGRPRRLQVGVGFDPERHLDGAARADLCSRRRRRE